MTTLTESEVEAAALDWQAAHGPDAAPDAFGAERDKHGQVPLELQPRGQSPPAGSAAAEADVGRGTDNI